jgi:hypothetical protein
MSNYQVVVAMFESDADSEPHGEMACNVASVIEAEEAVRDVFAKYQGGVAGIPLRVLQLDVPTPGIVSIFAKARTPQGGYIKAALRPLN